MTRGQLEAEIAAAHTEGLAMRFGAVLTLLGGRSAWYRSQKSASVAGGASPGRPRGPSPAPIDAWQEHVVLTVAKGCPWYDYKKIALICERLEEPIPQRIVYRVMHAHGLLQQAKQRLEERGQQETAKLYELLPKAPNELWQTDVTYVPIPGYGWWYVMSVIDYYSRYLLALRLVSSYSVAEAVTTVRQAVRQAEAIHGPLTQPVFLVTDNGPSFIAHRFREALASMRLAGTGFCALSHVRIGYRMPTQLGLLERFHGTLKREEVYWNLYADPLDAARRLARFEERYNCASYCPFGLCA